jgi:hypothetical protein
VNRDNSVNNMTQPLSCQDQVRTTGVAGAECLRAASPHIAHDIYLLRHAWVDRQLRIGWTLWFITARILMDFFFRYERSQDKKGNYSDNILASDFLPSGEWQATAARFAEAKPQEYDACRAIANKLSAHLTYSRIHLTADGPIPPSEPVHDYLLGVAGMWLDTLPTDRRLWFEPWFPLSPRAS